MDNSKNKIIAIIDYKLSNLNSVKNCDIIFKLENGNITKKGSFSEVAN